MWLADKLSNFLAGLLSKQIGRTEAALAAARGNPNVSLQEVKKVEKLLAEARAFRANGRESG